MNLMKLVLLSLITLSAVCPVSYAQSYSVIHTFTGTGGDGANPSAGVTLRAGSLWGATARGGDGYGTVYQMTKVGSDWTYKPIFYFPPDGSGGSSPSARVVFGPDGHLYGTTPTGGVTQNGVAFRLTVPVSICRTAFCPWKETVLHNFTQAPSDGAGPSAGDLTWDQQGNIYGTTEWGGTYSAGTVYQITPSGNSWTEAPIYSFSGPDGEDPRGGVIFDSSGNLFGTTNTDTVENSGVIFELTNVPGSGWQETLLHRLNGGETEGEWPEGGVVMDSAGNLFGTTPEGGNLNGGGTVFELSASGNGWTLTTLYDFTSVGGLTCGPAAPLTMDSAGNLYGTSSGGPRCGYPYGNIFKLTKTAFGWAYISLHEFAGGSDGGFPASVVTIDSDGTLYGVAGGGSNNAGVVWTIK